MPIMTHKSGMKEIRFGTGDIMINNTEMNDNPHSVGLCFKQTDEPREIGTTTGEFAGKTIVEFGAEVHFVFEKKESIKAVIDSLKEVYDRIPDRKEEYDE